MTMIWMYFYTPHQRNGNRVIHTFDDNYFLNQLKSVHKHAFQQFDKGLWSFDLKYKIIELGECTTLWMQQNI